VGETLPDTATGALFRLNVTGLASAAAYTSCLSRLYYYNTAADSGDFSAVVTGAVL
jgi:hypothetical protein